MLRKKIVNFCIDCNKQIPKKNLRCASCNYKLPERGATISKRQMLSGNPMWRGGKFNTADGYVKVKMRNHYLSDSNGYVPEHRLIASIKYNKQLTKQDVVHHLNGIRNDNRPENLVITDKKGNGEKTFIKCLQEHIKFLESQLSKL